MSYSVENKIKSLCDNFTAEIKRPQPSFDRLVEMVDSVHANGSLVGEMTYYADENGGGGSFRFLRAAFVMALNQWHARNGDFGFLKIAVHALYAMTSPTAPFRTLEQDYAEFAERAVIFAKHCNVPLQTYKLICAAFNIDDQAEYSANVGHYYDLLNTNDKKIMIPGKDCDLSDVVMEGKYRSMQTVVDRMFGIEF